MARKSFNDDWVEYHPGSVRPVLFMFNTLEMLFNIFCMAFHVTGFEASNIEEFEWEKHKMNLLYMATFYLFIVLCIFQSITLCTGGTSSINMELCRVTTAGIMFVGISLVAMWDAERLYYVCYESHEEVRPGKFIVNKPVHPYFFYMRGQSIASLACGVIYLLHACLIFDVKLTNAGGNIDYMPIPMFFCGRWVHMKLERYQWFREFSSNDHLSL